MNLCIVSYWRNTRLTHLVDSANFGVRRLVAALLSLNTGKRRQVAALQNQTTPNQTTPKFALACISLLFIVVIPSTRATSRLAAQSLDLNSLIDGLQRKYSRMQGLEADFIQIYHGSDGRVIRETGHVVLRRPRKARWEYSAPERKLFISDGKEVFFYVYGEKNATRSPIKEAADPQIPFLFLLGRGNLRRDFSRIEIATGELSIGAGNQVLRLFPKRAPEEFKQLLVEVSPASFEVRRMVIFERSGARMDFLLANLHENVMPPDSQFQFAAPPGVIVKRAQ